MKIDDQVEQVVRGTLHWVVKRRSVEFEKALRSIAVESRLPALELLVAISGVAAIDVFGGKPSSDQVSALAREVAESEDWAGVRAEEVATFLNASFAGNTLTDVLPAEDVFTLAFITAGSLLSSHPKAESEWWFDYLDKVEAAIEAAG